MPDEIFCVVAGNPLDCGRTERSVPHTKNPATVPLTKLRAERIGQRVRIGRFTRRARVTKKPYRCLKNTNALRVVKDPLRDILLRLRHIFKEVTKITRLRNPLYLREAKPPSVRHIGIRDTVAAFKAEMPVGPTGLRKLKFNEITLNRVTSLAQSVDHAPNAITTAIKGLLRPVKQLGIDCERNEKPTEQMGETALFETANHRAPSVIMPPRVRSIRGQRGLNARCDQPTKVWRRAHTPNQARERNAHLRISVLLPTVRHARAS